MVVALAALAATGCKSHRHLHRNDGAAQDSTRTETNVRREKPVRLDTIINSTYRYYTANFSCTVQGIAVNGQIRMVSDSIIWISVNKLIEVGRAIATPSGVKGYSKLLNKYFEGSYADIRNRWGIDADFGTLEALLTGNCPPRCEKSKEPLREGDTVTLWYRQRTDTQRQVTLKKSFKTKRITAAEVTAAAQGMKLQLNYLERRNFNAQMLPTRIALSLKSKRTNAETTINISKIVLGQREGFPFSIPKKAERL